MGPHSSAAGKPLLHLAAKGRVGIDADPFTAQISHSPFRRTAAAFRLDIAVVGSQIDTEAPVQQQIEELFKYGCLAHWRTWLCIPAVPSSIPCMILSTLSTTSPATLALG